MLSHFDFIFVIYLFVTILSSSSATKMNRGEVVLNERMICSKLFSSLDCVKNVSKHQIVILILLEESLNAFHFHNLISGFYRVSNKTHHKMFHTFDQNTKLPSFRPICKKTPILITQSSLEVGGF